MTLLMLSTMLSNKLSRRKKADEMRSSMDNTTHQMSTSVRERPHRSQITSTGTHRQSREPSVALLGMSQGETSRTESSRDSDSVWSPRKTETHNHEGAIRMGSETIRETQETVAWDLIPWMDDVVEKQRTHPALIALQAGTGLAFGFVIAFPLIQFVTWMAS